MNREETLVEIKEYSAYALSDNDLGGCGSPDSHDSPGAVLLRDTRDAFLNFMSANPDATGEDVRDAVGSIMADQVSIYTHTRWEEFVDLAAYQEEPEAGEWSEDLTEAAADALHQILERLVFRFAEMLDDAEDDD